MKRLIHLLTLCLALMLLSSTALAALPENYVMRHGSRDEKKIAITVDDCWKPEYLRKIHELSLELDFPITWFVVGTCLREGEEELWYEAIAHGSEIGNHTWKHSKLLKFSTSNCHTQVRKTQEYIDEYLGFHYPLRLLRPPYGQYKNSEKNFLKVFYEHGVEKVVLWDVSQTNPKQAFKDTQNGSILLFHTNPKDYECLKVLVPMLQEAGYELVTVSELLGLPPLELDIPDGLLPDVESTKAPI